MSKMIINGMEKNWSRLVVVYGLSREQIKDVEDAVTIRDCEVYPAEDFTDTIALPLMASIVDWNILSEDDKAFFVEYYSDFIPFAETVILIGDVDIPQEIKKRVSVYPTYEEFKSKMKYELLNAHGKIKKNTDYSKTLMFSLKILKSIRNKPYITTRELAEEIELSERSIQRYIETLRVAGEAIEYDVKRKGWKLLCDGMSILSGEVFDANDQ